MGALEKLIAALEAQTAAIEKMIAMSGGSKPTAEAPAEKRGPGRPPKDKTPKKTTVEDIAAAFGAYLGTKDKAERETRKGHVKAIVDYFGAAKATEIPEDSFDEALGYLKQYENGETPGFDGGDGEDESLV